MKLSENKPLKLFAAVCLVLLLFIAPLRVMTSMQTAPPPVRETNVVVQKAVHEAPAIAHVAPPKPIADPLQGDNKLTQTGIITDPDTIARLKKMSHSRRIASFMRSPARDTPECRKLLSILLANGRTIEDLPMVYDEVYHMGTMDPDKVSPTAKVNGAIYDPNNPDHVNAGQIYRNQITIMARMTLKNGGYSEDVINSILAINPKIAYGNIGVEISLEGARQDYTDEDLQKYLAENPVAP